MWSGRVAQVNLLCLQRVGSVRRLVVLTRPVCTFWRAWVLIYFSSCLVPILRKLICPTFPPQGAIPGKN